MTKKDIKKEITNNITIDSEEFKKEFNNLLSDYIEVKKDAVILGYDEKVFKFKDYVEYYIKLNKRN